VPQQALDQGRVGGHWDTGTEHPVAAPLVGDRTELVPQSLHELIGQGRVHADDDRDVVCSQPAEGVGPPQVLLGGEVAERAGSSACAHENRHSARARVDTDRKRASLPVAHVDASPRHGKGTLRLGGDE